jgi:hypothetical protein
MSIGWKIVEGSNWSCGTRRPGLDDESFETWGSRISDFDRELVCAIAVVDRCEGIGTRCSLTDDTLMIWFEGDTSFQRSSVRISIRQGKEQHGHQEVIHLRC